MTVVAKYFVVRDGVEIDQVFTEKKEAEAYDKMLDAAQEIAALIGQADFKIEIDSKIIEQISIHLAKNAPAVSRILKSVKPIKPASKQIVEDPSIEGDAAPQAKRRGRQPKSNAKSKADA